MEGAAPEVAEPAGIAEPAGTATPVIVAASIAHPVLLIRHAATSWTGRRWCGRADPSLTAEGRRAARRLAAELAAELRGPAAPVTLLVSPACRARETAVPIAAALEIEATVEPDLVEVDVGLAEGLEWAGLETRFPAVAADIASGIQPDWPGGETRAAVARRAARVASHIRAAATVGPLLVVSHGAILHAIVGRLVAGSTAAGHLDALGPAGILRLRPAPADGRVADLAPARP